MFRHMLAAAFLASAAPVLAADADIIWFGGTIITVNDAAPRAEAVAVKNGHIVAVGKKAAVFKAEQGKATRLVDLAGHTLVPGFVDGHGHISGVAIQAVSANLLPPPDGPATSIADVHRIMRDFIASLPAAKSGLAIGFDYDDSQLAERRAPTRQELDAVSTTIPIMVIHQSGHLGAFNSLALERAGITAASPDPSGGVIQREADGKTPDGVLEESALGLAAYKLFPKSTLNRGWRSSGPPRKSTWPTATPRCRTARPMRSRWRC